MDDNIAVLTGYVLFMILLAGVMYVVSLVFEHIGPSPAVILFIFGISGTALLSIKVTKWL